ncbi:MULTISPECIES: alpha/beta hydrolase [Ramlibacter]|nr:MULTISPECIES: alpha/beta hydrolase [Ramlibacter]
MSAATTLSVAGVQVHLEGEGGDVVLMLHGWPDTWRLWDGQVAALQGRFRCARFSLPGFEPGTPRAARTLDELVDTIAQVADAVSPGRPLTLLLHDWGCVFGYQYAMRHPQRVARIVGVDIGDPASLQKSLTAGDKLKVMAYQVWLAAAWAIGGRVGDGMTRWMARALRCPSDPAPMGAQMNYPYFMLWFGGRRSYARHSQAFRPACPLLFIYGKRKPFMFHSPAWAERVAAQPGCAVQGLDTGHWVMLNQPARFNQVLGDWLSLQTAVSS